MKIRLKTIDNPIVNELIESNNQQEKRLDILSSQYKKLSGELQKIKDDMYRKKSMDY